MQTIQVNVQDGIIDCDTGITVEMWKGILSNQKLAKPNCIDMLIKFYNEADHKSTCSTLAQKYDNDVVSAPKSYNSINTNFGKAICKEYDLSFQREDSKGECFWIVAMTGRDLENNHFEWKLRPELVQAMEELVIDCPDLSSLVDKTNTALGDFVDTFRYRRKELAQSARASKAGILFKYSDKNRNWAINEGGGVEVQYHLYLQNDEVGYGIGFNTQYVPFANDYTSVEYMRPYVGAYLKIKDNYPVTLLKECGFRWLYGSEEALQNLQNNEYYLLGKTFQLSNGTMKWIDFQDMLSHLKGDLFKLYTTIFSNKQLSVQQSRSSMNKIGSICQLLAQKKNLILQGAPGTGKTYTTASIAVRLCNKNFTEFADHRKVMEEYEKLQDEGQIAFCTFHQSMDYEDFVEGLKPEVKGNVVEYNVENGIFKTICEKAQTKENADIITCIDKYLQTIKGFDNRRTIPTLTGKSELFVWWTDGNDTISTRSVLSKSEKGEQYSPSPLNIEKVKLQAIGEGVENNWRQYSQAFINAVKKEYDLDNQVSDKPYVLIIDEINRGNVSKIFGELITLLEADKRCGEGNHHISLKLPYSKEDFSVPSNLYIIGTMNTTDRSTGTIDYAVRRRFAFMTLESSSDVIENWCTEKSVPSDVKDAALALFAQINGANKHDTQSFIAKHKAADFELEDLKVGHSYFMAKDMASLKMKMRYEVVPLIKEYIKDGILKGKSDDEKYFEKWLNAECYYKEATSYTAD